MVQRVEKRTIVLRNVTLETAALKERMYILGFGCGRPFPKDCGVNVWTIKLWRMELKFGTN